MEIIEVIYKAKTIITFIKDIFLRFLLCFILKKRCQVKERFKIIL